MKIQIQRTKHIYLNECDAASHVQIDVDVNVPVVNVLAVCRRETRLSILTSISTTFRTFASNLNLPFERLPITCRLLFTLGVKLWNELPSKLGIKRKNDE